MKKVILQPWTDPNIPLLKSRKSPLQRLTLQRFLLENSNLLNSLINNPISKWFLFLRMGSFNSAPKINNVDSQDDAVQIPNGLSIADFIYHCKMMRGENRPQLLTRAFLKPPTVSNLTSDVTDGMRVLNLDSVSHTCSPPRSPAEIRLLQWNILSQCEY